MNPICPLYHKDHASEGHDKLRARYPTPAMHVGPNYLYADIEDDEHINLHEVFVDTDGEVLTGDALAWALAQYLVDPVRLPIYAELSVWASLVDLPTYRLYTGSYEVGEEIKFQEDLSYVTAMVASGKPEALPVWEAAITGATYDTIRGIMLGVIRQFAGV